MGFLRFIKENVFEIVLNVASILSRPQYIGLSVLYNCIPPEVSRRLKFRPRYLYSPYRYLRSILLSGLYSALIDTHVMMLNFIKGLLFVGMEILHGDIPHGPPYWGPQCNAGLTFHFFFQRMVTTTVNLSSIHVDSLEQMKGPLYRCNAIIRMDAVLSNVKMITNIWK